MTQKLKPTYQRLIDLPERPFFLFGPRGVGKSTLLRQFLPDAIKFDLLDTALQIEFAKSPHLLEARIGKVSRESWVWIDEIQKVPALLDEVHRLIETRGLRFALSGSSARKLLREGANLLAGRATTKYLETFSQAELGRDFNLPKILEWGALPLVVQEPAAAKDILASYVHTYIQEEIKQEGLIRKAEPFLRFFEITGLLNAQILNAENIAREAQVQRKSVVSYFSILEDTLMGYRLPAYQPKLKVREISHPKFYWFDPGVARSAANLLNDPADSVWLGRALETMIFHELRVFNRYSKKERPIFYYRTGAGAEIDFVIETRRQTQSQKAAVVCIEVKYSKKWDRRSESAMRDLQKSGKLTVEKMFGVYMGDTKYHFDGLDVLPVLNFLELLHQGKVF